MLRETHSWTLTCQKTLFGGANMNLPGCLLTHQLLRLRDTLLDSGMEELLGTNLPGVC